MFCRDLGKLFPCFSGFGGFLAWDLFISGLLSATLLPGSSEALLLFRLHEGQEYWLVLLLSVTVGNVLGSLITYAMGLAGNRLAHQKWLGISEASLARAEAWFRRWGVFSLLLAWLPVVGDPLCLLAGLMRMNPWLFTLLVAIGKAGRYLFLTYMFIGPLGIS